MTFPPTCALRAASLTCVFDGCRYHAKKRGKKRERKEGDLWGSHFLHSFKIHYTSCRSTDTAEGCSTLNSHKRQTWARGGGLKKKKKKKHMVGAQDEFVASKAKVNHLCCCEEPTLFSNGTESVGVYAYTYGIVL